MGFHTADFGLAGAGEGAALREGGGGFGFLGEGRSGGGSGE